MGFKMKMPKFNVKLLWNPKAQTAALKGINKNSAQGLKQVNMFAANPVKATKKTVSFVARSKVIVPVVGAVAGYFGLSSLNKVANSYWSKKAARDKQAKEDSQAVLFPNVPVNANTPEAVAAGVATPNAPTASAANRGKSMFELLFGRFK